MSIIRKLLETCGLIRAVPPAVSAATATVRYVRGREIPPDIDPSNIKPWRTDAAGERWYLVSGGPTDA